MTQTITTTESLCFISSISQFSFFQMCFVPEAALKLCINSLLEQKCFHSLSSEKQNKKKPRMAASVSFTHYCFLFFFLKKEVLQYTTMCFTLHIKCTVLSIVNPNKSSYSFLVCLKKPYHSKVMVLLSSSYISWKWMQGENDMTSCADYKQKMVAIIEK